MIPGNEEFSRRKNRIKRIRTVFQVGILLILAVMLAGLFANLNTYQPYSVAEHSDSSIDTGFIAVSYFGVDRNGETAELIGRDLLRQHLKVLKEQGYVTISQKDIERYYADGELLPERALFLMFEDGRRDTAIFAQDILEELNYKATMLTYPEKFDNNDTKFLMPKELKDMEKSSYWEMGTNGYRLAYINVFDRYNNYIGELAPLKYSRISSCLGRRYNHYLMDYIRDENGIPKESYNRMKQRISNDYEALADIYTKQLGYVPGTYILMHSNTGRFGNSNQVSAVNEQWIRSLFKLNFNREGYALNQNNSSLYDLTRIQPQPYWPVNHLLMRLKYDINQPVEFVIGNEEKAAEWDLVDGAAEFVDETCTVTTLPESRGLLHLKNSSEYKDILLKVNLCGNMSGAQQIYLRTDNELKNCLIVSLNTGKLLIEEINNGSKKEIYKEKISVISGIEPISIEEAKKAAEVHELETFARYAENVDEGKAYLEKAKQRKADIPATIGDGAEPYEGNLSVHARSLHRLEISLKDDKISVNLDDKKPVQALKTTVNDAGSVYIGAGWDSSGWSQRNLADDVYDGVFEGLIIKTNTGVRESEEKVLFSSELTGWRKYQHDAVKLWDKIIGWFLKYL